MNSRTIFAIPLFVALAAILVARGIAPPMTKVGSDFPGYFTAAKIVADGKDVDRLYDNAWFQEQMRRYRVGEPSEGKFAPFPPPTALLLVPLSALSPLNALRVVTAVSVSCLLASAVLLAKILSCGVLESAIFMLLSGVAVLNGLRFGQPYILVSTLCIYGYYAYLKGRPLTAGLCLGLFAPIKYFPLGFLLYFGVRKQWKVVLGGGLAMLAVASLSVGFLGLRIHEEFLTSVLGNHLIAQLSMQDPFASSFQSFDTLFRRLFVFDAILNPRPLAALPGVQIAAVAMVKTLLVLAAAAALLKLSRHSNGLGPGIGIIGILILLIAPATATYHFVLLWLPVGLLARYFLDQRAAVQAGFLIGAYALIGFLPYGLGGYAEERGALMVLAYPRLLLLLAVFLNVAYFVWRRPVCHSDQAA